MSSILIESARILVDDELTTAHILTEDGVIKRISKIPITSSTDLRIDAGKLIALPGMIDAHVHLRDLDLSYKETFQTGTQAAAVGGFTTILDMPNTRPPTINSERLTEKIERAQGRLFANVAFQGALVADELELQRMRQLGAVAFKMYMNGTLQTFGLAHDSELSSALKAASKIDALVTVHAEDGVRLQKARERALSQRRTDIRDFLGVHSAQTEVSAVKRILKLASKLRLRIHICHITIPQSVRLVRRARNATCEATAHHLLLNQSIFQRQKTLAVCVPPIRSNRHREQLWRLFSRGQVEILASDHAPHSLDEKNDKDAWKAAKGVPGLETSLPVMFTQVSKGELSLRRLVDSTSKLPARIFRLSGKGSLKEGFHADVILVDPKAKTVITPANFLSKAKYSPFEKMRCVGRAVYTIVNGVLVAEDGGIVGPPAGKVIKGG